MKIIAYLLNSFQSLNPNVIFFWKCYTIRSTMRQKSRRNRIIRGISPCWRTGKSAPMLDNRSFSWYSKWHIQKNVKSPLNLAPYNVCKPSQGWRLTGCRRQFALLDQMAKTPRKQMAQIICRVVRSGLAKGRVLCYVYVLDEERRASAGRRQPNRSEARKYLQKGVDKREILPHN